MCEGKCPGRMSDTRIMNTDASMDTDISMDSTGGSVAQIAVVTLSGNSLWQTVHTHPVSVHQAAKLR